MLKKKLLAILPDIFVVVRIFSLEAHLSIDYQASLSFIILFLDIIDVLNNCYTSFTWVVLALTIASWKNVSF